MNTILRVLKAIFLPYFSSKEEQGFIKENSRHWKVSTGNPSILVETALTSPASLLEKFLIAKLIEQHCGVASVVLLNSFYKRASEAYAVAGSFGINHFSCWWRGYANPWFVMRCAVKALAIIQTCRTGRAMLELKIGSIHIGDLLYDTLIRYRPNCYTIENLSIRKHFRLIFRAVFNFHTSLKLFNTYNIKAVVTSHTVYAEFGILCRIAHARGASVFLKDMDVFRVYTPDVNICEHFLKVSTEELIRAQQDVSVVLRAEQYFAKRFSGNADQVDLKNAYSDKRMYSKAELFELLNINNTKKNVFVLAHAFSDAPHVGGKLAFDDYYIWLRETLLELEKNNEINVFVKPHPSSYMWGEKGAVEELLDDIGLTNIKITPKDMNTLSISTIADYVVTARGTAGLEYSGFGIPAITCGEGYYSGFGVAIEETSSEAYCNLLRKITLIPSLAPAISLRSRVLLYLTFNKLARSSIAPARHIYPGDDARLLIPEQFREMADKLRTNGSYTDEFTSTVKMAISNAL